MKNLIRPVLIIFSIFFFTESRAQSTTCPWVNAGLPATICAPNCSNLNATFLTTGQTTNYTISNIAYAPDPFTTGTALTLSDDQWSAIINLPFTFCYLGTAYTQLLVGSNGILSFNLTPAGGYCQWPINNAVPTTLDPMNTIMCPWQDLNPNLGGTIKYQTYGTAPCRRFVVSWNQVPMYSCGTPATQQICLYETTNIIDDFIQTKPLCATWNGGNAIQALHNATGTFAVVVPGRNFPTQWTATNEGKRYTPSGLNNYTFSWLANNVVVGTTPALSVCPTTTTVYTAQVVYTNCNNTTVAVTDTVRITVSSLAVTMSPNVAICTGGNATLNANATGATSYSWVPATGLSCTTCPNPVASPTVTTIYTCYVSNGTCQGQGTVTVTVSGNAAANAGPPVTICFGNTTQLNASGGSIYSWVPAATLSNPSISNPIASPTVTTTYTVYVSTPQGCQGNASVIVTVDPALSLSTAGFNTTCSNNCNGQAVTIPSGGTQPFTYSWLPSGGSNASATGLCAGLYTVIVTDIYGCTRQDTARVRNPLPITATTTTTNANCGTASGQACVTASGGTGVLTYSWAPGNQTTTCASNLLPGSYTVTVTDANGCTRIAIAVVGNNAGVVASISATTNATCFNSCNGTATASGTGGGPPYTYTWSTTPAQYTATATGLCAGSYTCTMRDANGCTSIATVTITQPQQVVVTPSQPVTICTSQCTTLTASATGGNNIYTYTWMPGNLTGSSVQVCPTATTQYTVTAADGNSCTSQPRTVIVTVRPPVTVTGNGSISVCPGICTNISAQALGGTGGPYTYSWAPGNLTGANVQVCPTANTTYTVTASDGCSPAVTATVTITMLSSPPVTFTVNNASGCAPLCVNFTNTTTNTSAWTWTFNGGSPASSNQQNPSNVCFVNPGNYSVSLQITTTQGCVASYTNNNMITVHPNPIADFSASPQPASSLLNNVVTFTNLSTGASNYTWNFNPNDPTAVSNLQNPKYTYTDSGTYVVNLTVSTQFGCTATITKNIIVLPEFTFYMPNAFTPNGDGLNDFFGPKSVYYDPKDFEMYIYDRWGNLVFKTTSFTRPWDGKDGSNQLAEEDVYVWKVIIRDFQNFKHEYVGHVSLLK